MDYPLKVKINTSWDFILGVSFHYGPIKYGGPHPSIEGATQKWVGFLLGQNKLTTTVRHRGRHIVQEKHNIGYMIPHFTITLPSNPWYFKMIPLSSCEVKFSSSRVRVDGKQVGCASLWPYMPMLCCGEPISFPLSFALGAHFCSKVRVGISVMDVIAGLVSIVLDIAVEMLFSAFGTAKGKKADGRSFAQNLNQPINLKHKKFNNFIGMLGGEYLEELVGFDPTNLQKSVKKKAMTALTGLIVSSLKGEPELSVSIGSDLAKVEAKLPLFTPERDIVEIDRKVLGKSLGSPFAQGGPLGLPDTVLGNGGGSGIGGGSGGEGRGGGGGGSSGGGGSNGSW